MKPLSLSDEERGRLETIIGHVFSEKQWLDRALTHASVGLAKDANYERLEFLGDRVLGLCVAELLFTTFRSAPEGELSVRLNQLVSAESCAIVADEMELHRFIRTGADVKKITGKRMMNVRADGARRDAKTELQEWAHAKFGVTPSYRIDDRSGPDHDPRFTVTVEIPGVSPETGADRSKRAAEQVAATRILEREGVWQKTSAED